MELFKGVCTALITPMTNGEVDYKSLEKTIIGSLESGVSAISVCGTTGEAATLTEREKRRVTVMAKDLTEGKIPIVRGIGSPDTAIAAKEAITAKKAGADILLALTPYYNKCTRSGLLAHMGAIAEVADLPIILYNVPTRTGVDISVDVTSELHAKYANILGIKEAGGRMDRILDLITATDLYVYGGDDALTLPTVACGGHGVISVTANIAPKTVSALVSAAFSGDRDTAIAIQKRLLPLTESLFREVNPVPVKFAAYYLGLIGSPETRLPLTPCSACEKLEKALLDFGFEKNGGAL